MLRLEPLISTTLSPCFQIYYKYIYIKSKAFSNNQKKEKTASEEAV